jgi:hypothetical protein
VNGKVHDQVVAPIGIDEEALKQLAVSSERVKKFMDAKRCSASSSCRRSW